MFDNANFENLKIRQYKLNHQTKGRNLKSVLSTACNEAHACPRLVAVNHKVTFSVKFE